MIALGAHLVAQAGISKLCALVPSLSGLANLTWFIGVGLGYGIYGTLMRRQPALAARAT